MFPAFRIISDGVPGNVDTFISNESFYAGQFAGTESTPQPSAGFGEEVAKYGYQTKTYEYEAPRQDENESNKEKAESQGDL